MTDRLLICLFFRQSLPGVQGQGYAYYAVSYEDPEILANLCAAHNIFAGKRRYYKESMEENCSKQRLTYGSPRNGRTAYKERCHREGSNLHMRPVNLYISDVLQENKLSPGSEYG